MRRQLFRLKVYAALIINIPLYNGYPQEITDVKKADHPLEEYLRLGWQSITVIAILKQPQ